MDGYQIHPRSPILAVTATTVGVETALSRSGWFLLSGPDSATGHGSLPPACLGSSRTCAGSTLLLFSDGVPLIPPCPMFRASRTAAVHPRKKKSPRQLVNGIATLVSVPKSV
jgi:hypothetical protein